MLAVALHSLRATPVASRPRSSQPTCPRPKREAPYRLTAHMGQASGSKVSLRDRHLGALPPPAQGFPLRSHERVPPAAPRALAAVHPRLGHFFLGESKFA